MFCRATNIILISFALTTLMMILLQSACSKIDKENDRDEFISSLKGGWKLSLFTKTPFQTGYPGGMYIQDCYDSVFYVLDDDTTYISMNDPKLCTLPGIENLQRWSITEKKNDLQLETKDLCGVTINYEIDFNNVSISTNTGWLYMDRDLKADINLIGSGITLTLDEFVIHDDMNFILYYRSDSQFKYSYYLDRYNYR
jgi:hypothetical protein